MIIQESASAKVNLFLHVGERRSDGFHPLQSLAVFTEISDVLSAQAAQQLSLAIDGPFAAGLAAEDDNLVLRAAKSLQSWALSAKAGRLSGASLTLTKNLPVASGIGGGSADAAAALRALKNLWRVEIGDTVVAEVAAGLGSDIPVCLLSQAAFMEGRGEILTPVTPLPRLAMLLVNPGVAVPTRAVFAGLQSRSGAAMALPRGGFADTGALLRFLQGTRNDLEAPAKAIQPAIGEVLAALESLPGIQLARMSGSGATCFALFPDQDSCKRAAALLQTAHGGWWVAPTVTR